MPDSSTLMFVLIALVCVIIVLQIVLRARPAAPDAALVGLPFALTQQGAQLTALSDKLGQHTLDLSRELSGFTREQTKELNGALEAQRAALARQEEAIRAVAPALATQLAADAEAARARLDALLAEQARHATELVGKLGEAALAETQARSAAAEAQRDAVARQDGVIATIAPALLAQTAKDAAETAAKLTEQREAQANDAAALRRDQASAVAETKAVFAAMGTAAVEAQRTLALASGAEMTKLRDLIDAKSNESRELVDTKLREMREANDAKLLEMQRTVNEQLQSAVEKQMNESFARVIDQFTAVQKAMGDVQAMTGQIGDLKRLFGNVKTRGGWGETQVRAQLDDILSERGYETNKRLRDDSADTVEFAVVMPTQGGAKVYLPVDAKFPVEDYERLLSAYEAGDLPAERAARKALATRIRDEALKIATKYICPPHTVEFAVMYLPTEGLYAEVARVDGLLEELGRQHRIMVLGPSLLPALLRTIQMGHVTLTLGQKADMVRELLGATKAEMMKMDDVLLRIGKQIGTVGKTIEAAKTRSRAVTRKLRGVDAIALDRVDSLLELEIEAADEEAEAAEAAE